MEKNIFTLLFQAALSERENRLMFQNNNTPEQPKQQTAEVKVEASPSDKSKEVLAKVEKNLAGKIKLTREQEKFVKDSANAIGRLFADPNARQELLDNAAVALQGLPKQLQDLIAKLPKQSKEQTVSVALTPEDKTTAFARLIAFGDQLKQMVPDAVSRDAMIADVSTKVKDFFKPAAKKSVAEKSETPAQGLKKDIEKVVALVGDQGKDHPETVAALKDLNEKAMSVISNEDGAEKAIADVLATVKGADSILSGDGKHYAVSFRGVTFEIGDAVAKGKGAAEKKDDKAESKEDKELNKFQQMLDMLLKFLEKMMQMENKNAINQGNVPAINAALKELDIKQTGLEKNSALTPEQKKEQVTLIETERAELKARLDAAVKMNQQFVQQFNVQAQQSQAPFRAEVPKTGPVTGGIVMVPNVQDTAAGKQGIKTFAKVATSRDPRIKFDQTTIAGRDAYAVTINGNVTINNINSITGNDNTQIARTKQGMDIARIGRDVTEDTPARPKAKPLPKNKPSGSAF